MGRKGMGSNLFLFYYLFFAEHLFHFHLDTPLLLQFFFSSNFFRRERFPFGIPFSRNPECEEMKENFTKKEVPNSSSFAVISPILQSLLVWEWRGERWK
jgi:hypothetical protein